MNLAQYQQEFSARGGVETEAMRRFREGHAEAGRWRQRAAAFERQLGVALDLPVPPDLVDSLLASAPLEPSTHAEVARVASAPGPDAETARRRRGRRWRLPLALAASLAGALALGLLLRPPDLGALPTLAAEHIGHHRAALSAPGPVPMASLRQAFAGFGRQPESIPTGLSFVSVCPLGDTGTVHLVLRDDDGHPVTAFFLRDAPATQVAVFERDGQAGGYLPLDNGGAVLMVGGNRADHAPLARRIDQALSPGGGGRVAAR